MISPSDISVVVQGPVIERQGSQTNVTAQVLASIRRQLPTAEVVLSTWSGMEGVSRLEPNLLVLSDDPGGMRYRADDPFENNINRQIRSTKAGLHRVGRRYTLKLRTDLMLCSTAFLDFFERFPARAEGFKLFEQRLLSCATYAINPLHGNLALFHPSDWVHFGRTEDMLKLWDVPEADEQELMRWFEKHPPDWAALARRLDGGGSQWRKAWHAALRSARNLQSDGLAAQFSPEQYLWIQALRKIGYEGFKDALDVGFETVRDSETSLANNFVILQAHQFGIRSFKYDAQHEERQTRLYTHVEWLRMHRRMTGGHEGAGIREWLIHGRAKLSRSSVAVSSMLRQLRSSSSRLPSILSGKQGGRSFRNG